MRVPDEVLDPMEAPRRLADNTEPTGGTSIGELDSLARMKKCAYCGTECPDEAALCAIDQDPLGSDTSILV